MTTHRPNKLPVLRRSNAPIFWLLFGAGGMLSALFGPILVLLTTMALPQAWWVSERYLDYSTARAFMHQPLNKVWVFAVVVLFVWHAAHRLFKCLHDFGIHPSWRSKMACYGSALVLTLVASIFVIQI